MILYHLFAQKSRYALSPPSKYRSRKTQNLAVTVVKPVLCPVSGKYRMLHTKHTKSPPRLGQRNTFFHQRSVIPCIMQRQRTDDNVQLLSGKESSSIAACRYSILAESVFSLAVSSIFGNVRSQLFGLPVHRHNGNASRSRIPNPIPPSRQIRQQRFQLPPFPGAFQPPFGNGLFGCTFQKHRIIVSVLFHCSVSYRECFAQ